jgi:hypothetical protein
MRELDLNLDDFVNRIVRLRLALLFVIPSIQELEKDPRFAASFDLSVPPAGSNLVPPLGIESLLAGIREAMASDQRAMHREVMARATVVYAWALLENLLEDCSDASITRSRSC